MEIFDPSNIRYEEYRFRTYAVVDGVKYPMLWSDLEDGLLEYDILFKEEKLRKKLFKVAPFLIALDFESEGGKEESLALIETCRMHNGAIFFSTHLTFGQTLEKMRTLFYLYDDEEKVEGVLRFYEPRIFSELMHEPNKALHQAFFSKVYCYWCEDTKEENSIAKYFYTPKGIGHQHITLECKSGENSPYV
ncbi:DUF4123 domain-containing protein [Hydrogenimonas sp.]